MFEEPVYFEQYSRPAFHAWFKYCFTRGAEDFAGSIEDQPRQSRRFEFVLTIDPALLTKHMTKLFESPGMIAERFSDAQIAAGISFLFGIQSYCFYRVLDERVQEAARDRCIRSIVTLYTDLLDRVCGKGPKDAGFGKGKISEALEQFPAFDREIYGLWENDCSCYAVLPLEGPDDAFERGVWVFEEILTRCQTSACRISALYKLGNAICVLRRPKPRIARLQAAIDRFLKESEPPRWLAQYARDARTGDAW
ncbi:MAG: hypothetical protein JJU33_10435 [Phycisphaerales bacterium]|nr:hypothetical protein [Phycisphaerales bacterium]